MTALSSASVLRAVMDGVPAAVAVVDDGMRVLEANARWSAIGPAVGTDWREVVHPADRDLVPTGPGPAVEVRVRVPDGAVRWFSLVVREAEDVAGGAVVLTDIDAARAAEGERAALRRTADGISREHDPGALFAQVAEEAGTLLSADGAGVARFDDPPCRWTARAPPPGCTPPASRRGSPTRRSRRSRGGRRSSCRSASAGSCGARSAP